MPRNKSDFFANDAALSFLMFLQSDKSNGSNQGGPTQRASALAALSSAFNSSSGARSTSASRLSGASQGSQRAAAVAALSQVLTAEKKQSPEVSPARPSRSPPVEASPPGVETITIILIF